MYRTNGRGGGCCKVASLISVDEHGQMVLPEEVREKANIRPGDKLALVSWEKNGKVIGVDMTSEMIDKALENAEKGNYENVEFRLGEIERLPVADETVDLIISHCVINLPPDKGRVFRESFRVLKPGGRIMISDMVLLRELPDSIKHSIEAYIGCVSGAIKKDEYLQKIKEAGFQDVKVMGETSFSVEFILNDPAVKAIVQNSGIPSQKVEEIAGSVVSIKIAGVKPPAKN